MKFWVHGVPWWFWLAGVVVLAHLIAMIIFLARGPRWFAGRDERQILEAAALEILEHRRASGEITEEQYLGLKKHPKAIQ